MKVTCTLTKTKEAIAAFHGATDHLTKVFAGGLYQEAQKVLTESKEKYVPVEWGVLRDSGFVDLPEVNGTHVMVQLGFGGPAKGNDDADGYALIQHENLTYHHKVGQSKYLETPMNEAADGIDDRLAGYFK